MLYTILSGETYGVIGTLFSTIYLGIAVLDLGITRAIPSFINEFTISQSLFKKFLLNIVGLQALIFFAGGTIVGIIWHTYFITHHVHAQIPVAIILIIVMSEGIRMLLRVMLYNVAYYRITMIIDLLVMILYLMLVWIPYALHAQLPTCNSVFIPYASTSVLATSAFLWSLVVYKGRLSDEFRVMPHSIWRRIWHIRIQSYLLEISSKGMFTGNLLVTLFAIRGGFVSAGVLKCASYIADGLKGILHATIGFSGNALLANIKSHAVEYKQQAFSLMSRTGFSIIMYSSFFVILSWYTLINYQNTGSLASLLPPLALFLILNSFEHMSSVYQQYYTMEEKLLPLLMIRAVELCAWVVLLTFITNSFYTLCGFLVIRIVGLCGIGSIAYRQFGIFPSLLSTRNIALMTRFNLFNAVNSRNK